MIRNKLLRARRHLLFESMWGELGEVSLFRHGVDMNTSAIFEEYFLRGRKYDLVLYIEAEPDGHDLMWCRVAPSGAYYSRWIDPIRNPDGLRGQLSRHGGPRLWERS